MITHAVEIIRSNLIALETHLRDGFIIIAGDQWGDKEQPVVFITALS
jgi:hypothetical protein